jgi:DNA-binding response OmpR family regulator
VKGPLSDLRILIVEDEYMLAMELAGAIQGAGGEVAAMVASLDDAEQATNQQLDGAILDIQLGDKKSFDLARRMRALRIPVVFTTGYDHAIVPEELMTVPHLTKPLSLSEVVRQAARTFVHESAGKASDDG